MAMNRCYGYQCHRKGTFQIEPVEDMHVWVCDKCFTDKYGEDAVFKFILGTLPIPMAPRQVEVIESSESVRTIRASGHGEAIPRDYRRDVNTRMYA